jgi:hypothetical protein
MAQEAQIERDKVKLLLLGAGESGIYIYVFKCV